MKSLNVKAYAKPLAISLLCVAIIAAATLTGCHLSSLASRRNGLTEVSGDAEINKDVQNGTSNGTTVLVYNVLTGLRTTSELADLRPVAICMENTPYSYPQYGLSAAQVLIEVPLEDGSTRLMMLTTDYTTVTTIGAISSMREYLFEIGDVFGAIFCYNGTGETMKEEEAALYDGLDYSTGRLAGVFYQDPTRFEPNALMTNGILVDSGIRREELSAKASDISLPYAFAQGNRSLKGGTGTQLTVSYSQDLNVVYTYDATSGKYLRSQYGVPQLDGNNGEQVGFDNLFILYASSLTYESEDGMSRDFVLEDGGTGLYLNGGAYESIRWNMQEDGSIIFFDDSDEVLEINRGTSYIGLVGAGEKDSVKIQ